MNLLPSNTSNTCSANRFNTLPQQTTLIYLIVHHQDYMYQLCACVCHRVVSAPRIRLTAPSCSGARQQPRDSGSFRAPPEPDTAPAEPRCPRSRQKVTSRSRVVWRSSPSFLVRPPPIRAARAPDKRARAARFRVARALAPAAAPDVRCRTESQATASTRFCTNVASTLLRPSAASTSTA